MTPSPSVSADIVGQVPWPLMWMCCTCGYGSLPNIAGRPDAFSVIVAVLPSSVSINVPDADEPLSGVSVASYDWVAATAGAAASATPPNATDPAASTASIGFR